jgi:threonine/homoserine/homoserine lactone efflux protein
MIEPLLALPLASPGLLGPLALFTLVSFITPGPNNAMLAASGLTFGLRRSLPHLLGVNLGFTAMVVLVGLGLGGLFTRLPVLYEALKYAGSAYLLWLAWKIAASGPLRDGTERGSPFTFIQAVLFQWVNPKAWVMSVGIIAAYTPRNGFLGNLGIAAIVCVVVGLPCIGAWLVCGNALRRWLHRPGMIRAFNVTMALLLVASLYPVALELLRAA